MGNKGGKNHISIPPSEEPLGSPPLCLTQHLPLRGVGGELGGMKNDFKYFVTHSRGLKTESRLSES